MATYINDQEKSFDYSSLSIAPKILYVRETQYNLYSALFTKWMHTQIELEPTRFTNQTGVSSNIDLLSNKESRSLSRKS